MPVADYGLEYLSADACRRYPHRYKLCTSSICVRIGSLCPCQHGVEYRCDDGQCILSSARCDGIRQCVSGEDELECPGAGQVVTSPEDGLPVEMIVVIVTMCLVVCVATLCLLVFFVFRRRKNNTSRESQSVTQPLKTRYPSAVVDSSEKFDESSKAKRDYIYHQMYDASEDFELTMDKNKTDRMPQRQNTDVDQIIKPQTKTFLPNLCAIKSMKIYDFDHEFNNSVSNCEMGKYIFKPRIKKAHAQKDMKMKRASENHEIVHSYKHVDRNRFSLPAAFNFDIDPEKFQSTFATELLCSSTPRQPARRLFLHGSHQSLSDDDNMLKLPRSHSPIHSEKSDTDIVTSQGRPRDSSIEESMPLSIPNNFNENATIYL